MAAFKALSWYNGLKPITQVKIRNFLCRKLIMHKSGSSSFYYRLFLKLVYTSNTNFRKSFLLLSRFCFFFHFYFLFLHFYFISINYNPSIYIAAICSTFLYGYMVNMETWSIRVEDIKNRWPFISKIYCMDPSNR